LLEIEPNDNVEILYGEDKVKLGKIDGYSESKEYTYILRIKKRTVLHVSVTSAKAGKASKQIELK
jgi:hypothetical protein